MKAENVKLGIAPIGWTNDDMPDLGKENTFEQCVTSPGRGMLPPPIIATVEEV